MKTKPIVTLHLLLVASVLADSVTADESPIIRFQQENGELTITVGGDPLATYIYQDENTPRPYFAHVFAPGKTQVTRNHPPVKGKDTTDHAKFHPGIWLAFGDVSGNDYWRLKAKVVHDGFASSPKGGRGHGAFRVRNRYQSADGKRTVCVESCRYTFLVRPAGYLLICDSRFSSDDNSFYFGDQEEMGLGVRVASPIAVSKGGRILNSDRLVNEKGAWGKQADWCDYSGVIDAQRVGMTIFTGELNFRRSWFHARDYGFVAANPFGRNAFTRGTKSKVTVAAGDSLRLRFGVLLHSTAKDRTTDLNAAYRDFLDQIEKLDK